MGWHDEDLINWATEKERAFIIELVEDISSLFFNKQPTWALPVMALNKMVSILDERRSKDRGIEDANP